MFLQYSVGGFSRPFGWKGLADLVYFQRVVSTVKFILPMIHKSVDCNVKSQRKLPSENFAKSSLPV